jgi:hypothetical protein
MYNLTVAVAHTFFVGDGQWLVHNSCSGPGLASRAKAYLKSLPDRFRGVTVAVSEIDNVPYVSINGAADSGAVGKIRSIVEKQGGKFIFEQGLGPEFHAERVLYRHLSDQPNLTIGISGKVMCPSCEKFFSTLSNVTVYPFKR